MTTEDKGASEHGGGKSHRRIITDTRANYHADAGALVELVEIALYDGRIVSPDDADSLIRALAAAPPMDPPVRASTAPPAAAMPSIAEPLLDASEAPMCSALASSRMSF